MPILLVFNVDNPEKRTAIRLISMRLGLSVRDVPPEYQSSSLAELLSDAQLGPPSVDFVPFSDELLVMYDLPSTAFHDLLDTLRREGQSIRLKAVVTDHNRGWTALHLYQELCAEEAAVAGIRKQSQSKHPSARSSKRRK